MQKEYMLTDNNFSFLNLIAQFSDTFDITGMQDISSMALQYGSTISQTSPSSILDWVLTFADIAGVAAIGLVVAVVYFQSRQRKFAGLIEIFKLLNGKVVTLRMKKNYGPIPFVKGRRSQGDCGNDLVRIHGIQVVVASSQCQHLCLYRQQQPDQ